MTATTDLAIQVYQVFIKASPDKIWEAITTPGYTARYFHGARIEVSSERYVSQGPGRRHMGRRSGARVRPAAAPGARMAFAV